MSKNIAGIAPGDIDEIWLLNCLSTEFDKPDENITALKILAKQGTAIHDQSTQLNNKSVIHKLNSLLKILKEKDVLEMKNNPHDTLGMKEVAYKLKKRIKHRLYTAPNMGLQPLLA